MFISVAQERYLHDRAVSSEHRLFSVFFVTPVFWFTAAD